MKKTVRELENQLKWPVEIKKSDGDLCECSCDPSGKKHIFFLPEGENQSSVRFKRCLCQASLAERVHPLFSVVIVEGPESVPERVFENHIWPIFCVSRFWFADALLAERFPEESRDDIEEKLDLIDRSFPDGQIKADFFHTLQVALTLAEAKYLWKINRKPQGTIGDITRAFLEIDPSRPDLEKLKDLNNSFLTKHSNFSAELVHNREMGTVWRIF